MVIVMVDMEVVLKEVRDVDMMVVYMDDVVMVAVLVEWFTYTGSKNILKKCGATTSACTTDTS